MSNNYYNSNFNFFQVINNNSVNVVVNNFYNSERDVVFHQQDVSEQSEQQEQQDRSVTWDLAEEFEENINDLKEKFLPSKLKTLKLENIYIYLKDYVKAYNLHNCGTYLEFAIKHGETIDKKKLRKINSCKLRLCPYCAWRRSLRVFSNVLKCYNYIESQDEKIKEIDSKSRFLFLTLTSKNVTFEDLAGEVQNMMSAFNRFSQYKAFKNAFKGFIRTLEVTCDREPIITQEMYDGKKHDYYVKRNLFVGDKNPTYLTFNVHIHVLLHTTYKQYRGENYLREEVISKLWKKALRVDYLPIIWIEPYKAKSKETKGKELAEMAKYAVKPTDYLRADYVERDDLIANIRSTKSAADSDSEFLLDVKVIHFLDGALSGRRLIAFGGTFREAYQALKLDDDKMVDDEEEKTAEEYILKYYFSFKDKLYKRILH